MIINPIWFYLVDVATKVGGLFFGLGFAGIGIVIICLLMSLMECDIPEKLKKNYGKIISLCIILFTLSSFVPEKETCYQMMAASLVTKENIEYVGETGKNIIDYIVESIDTLIEENEAKEGE